MSLETAEKLQLLALSPEELEANIKRRESLIRAEVCVLVLTKELRRVAQPIWRDTPEMNMSKVVERMPELRPTYELWLKALDHLKRTKIEFHAVELATMHPRESWLGYLREIDHGPMLDPGEMNTGIFIRARELGGGGANPLTFARAAAKVRA